MPATRSLTAQPLREAALVLAVWGLAFGWSIGAAAFYGYDVSRKVTTVYGFPDWVFWGIVIPWLLCTIISSLVAWLGMSDEALIEEETPSAANGEQT